MVLHGGEDVGVENVVVQKLQNSGWFCSSG